ncbi:PIR protein [Plasmodium yoelii]|uniref:Yir2 protein n=3 Tax=Plasmodium yoelii TaxID=5861 RepID=Q7RJR4_PLAYO|nr:PIR protein [Plasmodium yoelii]EAA22748.1 putative yir2 protein [Plasmodium yoelii yoelii]WBY59559.1 PIR protein [Plasmodium yoelii yoelii]VTZ80301.1 PIR protein [Plasmodium yoelii]|eukprot:XP_022812763.1 PIR protein [Plasmodium yoelii]
MDDTLCGQFDFVRKYLPDELSKEAEFELNDNESFKKYCPITDSGKNECNNDLDNFTAGFLWLLGECYSESTKKIYNENTINAFFLYMISWFSNKLKQKSIYNTTSLNDFYDTHVKNNDKYNSFTDPAYKISELKKFMDDRNDFLNINIEDLSKFYDVFNLLCKMHGNVTQNQKDDTLSNNAIDFVKKYQELNKVYGIIGEKPYNKIFSTLSTDYNNLKDKCTNCSSLPEITAKISALRSGYTSSSSIGNRLFTVLSIFGAIAFFLGISYKYSLFGFRKRFQKQKLREKIKNIKKKMNR